MQSPLLPFSGGLRSQAPFILECINHFVKKTNSKKIFCDPFYGGGSISYEARLKGYTVLASDIAMRSYVPAKCLVEGVSQIKPYELAQYITSLEPNKLDFKNKKKVLKVLYPQPVELIRGLLELAPSPEIKYLALRCLFDLVPMGGFGLMKRTESSESALSGWKQCLSLCENPITTISKMKSVINTGLILMSDKPIGAAYQLDAREHIDISIKNGATCVHLDPPTYGTKGYTNLYWWLDALLGDEAVEKAEGFNKAGALAFVNSCVEAACDAPVVAITQQEVSYPLQEAIKVLNKHNRKTFAYEIPIANTSNPFYIVIGIK